MLYKTQRRPIPTLYRSLTLFFKKSSQFNCSLTLMRKAFPTDLVPVESTMRSLNVVIKFSCTEVDVEASTWSQPLKKWNQQLQSDPIPSNLAFCSAFKLDSQNIGVLWSDLTNVMRSSVYNVIKKSWKNLRLSTPTESGIQYRIGSSLLTKYNDLLILEEAKQIHEAS